MYIVTDLTRFGAGNPNVCTALINMDTRKCVRPMPYFTYELMKKYNVLPGALFEGKFIPARVLENPHYEDCNYSDLKLVGSATGKDFKDVLLQTASKSVSAGFEYEFCDGQKVVPLGTELPRSIITLKVNQKNFEVLPDGYNERKIKVNFSDNNGHWFRYLPVTDLGFFDYTSANRDAKSLKSLNEHIQSSDDLFVRLGLSRKHQQGDRNGYWLQVNGIYTFPSKISVVRGYK